MSSGFTVCGDIAFKVSCFHMGPRRFKQEVKKSRTRDCMGVLINNSRNIRGNSGWGPQVS